MRAALLLLGLAAAARAEAPSALLWVPAGPLDPARLAGLFERFPEARLSVALPPDGISPDASPIIGAWTAEGRLELALRIPGDPFLPPVERLRPGEAAYRLAACRQQARATLGPVSGFVPGGGALTPELAAALRAQRFGWAATGRPQDIGGGASSPTGGLALVGFSAWAPDPLGEEDPPPPPGAVVLDEAAGMLAPGSGPAALERLFARGDRRWTTVSASLAGRDEAEPEPSFPPGWSPEAEGRGEDPAVRRAWEAYARAAEAMSRYQNSGRASVAVLDKAAAALQAAAASRFYRAASLREPGVEAELRSLLNGVFRAVRAPAPDALKRPLLAGGSAPEREAPPGEVEAVAGPGFLRLTNPDDPAAVRAGSAAIRSLEARWNEDRVEFRVGLDRVPPQGPPPVDLYIDLNGMSGRGSTALLPGRMGFVAAEDAWEYVLTLGGAASGLYRSVPGSEPALVASVSPELEGGVLRASLPRSRLRGNPAGWGYLLLAASSEQGPASALLGALETQRRLAEPGSAYRRFPAVRIPQTRN